MTNFVNEVMGNLRRNPQLSSMGPMLESFMYVDRFQQNMFVVECDIAHGAQVDSAFGYFVEIVNPGNTNKSRLKISFTPTFSGDTPTFAVRSERVEPFNEYICKATITRQIVQPATEPDTGANIWESTVKPIDDVHSLKTTITVVSLATLTGSEWDEALNVWVTSDRVLTQTSAAPTVTVDGTNVVHTFYQQMKCGWYLKTIEKFPKLNRTYWTNIEFYWPAVLHQTTPLETKPYDRKDLADGSPGGSNNYVDVIFIKEAYRGPCKAQVTEVWNLAAVDPLPEPQVMLPLPLTYQSPFSSFNIGPTLHALIEYDSVISDDPEFEDVVINYTWGATTPTDWPASIIASDAQEPVRGGYLRRTILVYPPDYTP